MNNRQNNRRRGRGGNRQNNNRSGVDHQNRIDNRARGNASQMLDKYKKLANDAQLNGDRVNAEYYLQFADHYFRVLADYRARQEAKQEAKQEERRQREEERSAGDDSRDGDKPRAQADEGEKAQKEKPARKPRGRKPREANGADKSANGSGDADGGIDLAVLPPSISADDDEGKEEKPKRKPRARRAKGDEDGGEEVSAPAE